MYDNVCGDCRYWSMTGLKDSGLTLPHSRAPWLYRVGHCVCAQSPHFTDATKERLGKTEPEWSSCYMHAGKSRRRARIDEKEQCGYNEDAESGGAGNPDEA